jgi:hypothetical protein
MRGTFRDVQGNGGYKKGYCELRQSKARDFQSAMDGPEGGVPTEKPQLDSRVVKFPHAASDAPPPSEAEDRCSA